jgi:hypothetical protein
MEKERTRHHDAPWGLETLMSASVQTPTWDDYVAACRRIAERAIRRHAASREGKVVEPLGDVDLATEAADRKIIARFREGRLTGFLDESARRSP